MNENAKTKLVLEYTGMDDFSCPVYKDQFGKLWKDIDLGKEPEPNLYSLSFNHIDGEPSHPIQQEYTFHPAPYQRSSYEFEYRMLSKLQSSCGLMTWILNCQIKPWLRPKSFGMSGIGSSMRHWIN